MNLINSLSMGSQEIAFHSGKENRQVLRDIRNMLKGLDLPVPDFDNPKVDYLENQQFIARSCPQTKRVREIFLPKDLTLTLVSGWEVKMRLLKAPRRLVQDSPPARLPGAWSPGRVLPSRSRTSSLFSHGRKSQQSGYG